MYMYMYYAYAAPCVGDTRGRPECRPPASGLQSRFPSGGPTSRTSGGGGKTGGNKRGGKTGGTDPGCNPASGCCNCKDWWALGCHIGKLSCEFTTSVMGTSNAFQQGLKGQLPLIGIAAVVGIVVLILILKR